MPARKDAFTLVAIATVVIGLDQLSKSMLVSALSAGRIDTRTNLVDGWLAVEYTENRGAAFGLLAGLAPVLVAASIAILAGLLIHFSVQAKPSWWETVATGLIAGGAIGNLIDRARLGYVVDFLAIGPWPNFNIADSAITIGVVLLIWGWAQSDSLFSSARTRDQES